MASYVPVKAQGHVAETLIDGELVLMNLDNGAFNVLRDTGLAIWQSIDGTRDIAALTALMAERYDAPPARCAAEVEAFCQSLIAAGLAARG